MNIQELLDEVAKEPAPPTRLTAGAVFAAGRRRYRRTRRNQSLLLGGSLAVALGLIAGGARVLTAGPTAPVFEEVPMASPLPSPSNAPGAAPPPAPKLDCTELAARVKSSLQASGFPKAAEGKASCDADRVTVTIAVVREPVKVDIVVEVRLGGTVRICGSTGCQDYPRNGQVFDNDGMVALGRSDGLVINVHTITDMSGLPGSVPNRPVISVEQLKGMTLDLSGELPAQ